jgi:hypothetical protein
MPPGKGWLTLATALMLQIGSVLPSRAAEPPVLPIYIADIVSLPFMGQWPFAELDRELDAIAAAGGLPADTRRELDTAPGKFALWQSVIGHARSRRDAWYGTALASLDGSSVAGATPAEAARHGLAGLFFPLVRYGSGLQGDVDALARELSTISDRLRGDSQLARRLHSVLSTPGAAEAVYVSFVYPVYLARGGAPGFEALFERDASGAVHVRPGARGKAKSSADRLVPLARAVDKVARDAAAKAGRISGDSQLERAYREALTDPVTTGLVASVMSQRQPRMGASGLADATGKQLFEKWTDAGGSMVLANGVDTDKAERDLAQLYRLRAITHGNAIYLETLGSAAAAGGVDDDLRTLLSSPFFAASLLPGESTKPLSDVFRKASILGSALIEDGKGGWTINPHRERELSIALGYLELRLKDYWAHAEQLRAFASAPRFALGGGFSSRLAEFAALEIAGIKALKDPRSMLDSWRDEYFAAAGKGLEARGSRSGELQEVARDADKVRARMNAQPPPVRIDLSGEFATAHVELLRSSAYVYLGSKFARETYFNEFDDHYAVRLWGIFDWNAQTAKDAREFREELSKQAPFLRRIAATHKKVVIYVFHTPHWLSASNDQQQVDGRPAYLLHPPGDYAAWRRFVGDTVDFLAAHLKGVDVYYEFWNEPEIYWPGSIEDFLRLYAETAKAIKANHPEAKVGGATVNGWDGKLKNSGTSEPLNISLIRYAVNNGLPLDFIAWHYFERPLNDLELAKQAYFDELRKFGVDRMPELVISEWSIPQRGSQLEAMLFAEYMLALYQAKVDIQAVSAWDEFSVLPRPGYFAPWGMLTHQGFKKPMYHVHAMFDRLSRGSTGVAVFASDDGRSQVVLSRKGTGRYELVAWERRYSPELDAALAILKERGLDQGDLREYGSLAELEEAVRQGKARNSRHADAFRAAQETYRGAGPGENYFSLEFAGAKEIVVRDMQAVGAKLVSRQALTDGGKLVTNLARGEVIWLSLQVK